MSCVSGAPHSRRPGENDFRCCRARRSVAASRRRGPFARPASSWIFRAGCAREPAFQPVARRRLAAVFELFKPSRRSSFGDPRLQSRDFGRLRLNQRNQFFPGRLKRRFENHLILESETESAVRNFYRPTQTAITKPGQLRKRFIWIICEGGAMTNGVRIYERISPSARFGAAVHRGQRNV